MVREEAVRAFEEVGINDIETVFAVIVVPGNVHSVPFIIVHENVIPHMGHRGFLIPVTENADTGNPDAVADQLKGFGVALTDNAGLHEGTDSRKAELSFRIVEGTHSDIILNGFQLFVAGITGNREIRDLPEELRLILIDLIDGLKSRQSGGSDNELIDSELIHIRAPAVGIRHRADADADHTVIDPEDLRTVEHSAVHTRLTVAEDEVIELFLFGIIEGT